MRKKNEIEGFIYYSTKTKEGYKLDFDSGAAVARVETVMLTEEEYALIQSDPAMFYTVVVAAMNREQ